MECVARRVSRFVRVVFLFGTGIVQLLSIARYARKFMLSTQLMAVHERT